MCHVSYVFVPRLNLELIYPTFCSPTATLFSAVIATTSASFLIYHIWRFNRFRCLLYQKDDAFRWIITWCLLISSFSVRPAPLLDSTGLMNGIGR